VKEGYFILFFVEYNDYFNNTERKFLEGPKKMDATRNFIVDQDIFRG